MFGKKSATKKAAQNSQPEKENGAHDHWNNRVYAEGVGHVWAALTGMDPRVVIPQVVGTVLHEGGTRPPWQWEKNGTEYILMAWPQDQPIRAAVLMAGPKGEKLKPITAVPLLEGLPNDLTVEEIHKRLEGEGGDIGVAMIEGKNPMWFFDPLFVRDEADLTPGVTHTFWVAAAALRIRKALLDEISLTDGPQFEEWAKKWLEENPGKERRQIPPLKIDIRDKPMIMPGRAFGEYQLRAKIEKIDDWQLEKMPIKVLYLQFPFDNRPNLHLPLYVSQTTLAGYDPQPGEEIEAYVWFEGRIIDLENVTEQNNGQSQS